MKILFASSAFGGGGVTTYAMEVINNYAGDCQMDVMFRDCKRLDLPQVHNAYDCDLNNLAIDNARLVCRLINDEICPEAIIVSNAPLVMLLAPFLNDNIKVVSVSHSLRNKEATNAALTHNYQDAVVALSVAGQRYLHKSFGVLKDKLPVIYNFIREHPDKDAILQEKRERRPLTIVFPGSCSAVKSPDIVIAVLQKLVQTDLNFCFKWLGGLNPTGQRWYPVHDVSRLVPPDGRVYFHGRLPHNEFAENVCRANIILSPSRREGCPMALLEAMRTGCITLVADYDVANRELVRDGISGYVIGHDDIDGFVKRIEEIVSHPEMFDTFYDAGYAIFKEKLSYESWKKKMDEVLIQSACCHKKRHEFSAMSYRLWVLRFRITRLADAFYRYTCEKIPTLIKLLKLKG